MPDSIKDGSSGRTAGVNDVNRLDTSSNIGARIYYESRDYQNTFGITTPQLTITTTGGRILYLKNTSTSMNMVITDLRIGWNGGTTNHILALLHSIYFGDAAPSANHTTGAAGNLNRGSNKTFDIDVVYWDEVGDGMTISGGSAGMNMVLGVGTTYLPIQGAIILGPNNTMAFNLKAEEIGEATINLLGFVEDIK